MTLEKVPTILIADDDEQTLRILEQILRIQGYGVITARDGFAAQERIAADRPDLIILDNHMPGMTGTEICRAVKSDPATRLTPVIMLTGYTESPEKLESIEAGADDFVNKPYKSIELVTRIKSLLNMKFLNDELDSAEGVIFALARAIEAKDTYTQGHTERVSQFALAVGYHLGLSDEEQNALYKGGILHDIGKIAIPDAILNKSGRLNIDEFSTIRTHPDRGEKICLPLKSIKSALQVIRYHHEKMDGSGYPDQLSGEQIPMVARVMAIVDVYDALTSRRAYRVALPQEAAMNILEAEADRGWWDKRILQEFKRITTAA
jgi:putative two-component system response regulator